MLPNEELPNPPVTKRRPNTAATLVEVGEEMRKGFTLIGNAVRAHSSGDLRMAELCRLEAEGALTAALRKLSEIGETEASSLEPQFTVSTSCVSLMSFTEKPGSHNFPNCILLLSSPTRRP
jgi:hypothetical protein